MQQDNFLLIITKLQVIRSNIHQVGIENLQKLNRNQICISYLLAPSPYTFNSSIHQVMLRNKLLVGLRKASLGLRGWCFACNCLHSWNIGRNFAYWWPNRPWDVCSFRGILHREKVKQVTQVMFQYYHWCDNYLQFCTCTDAVSLPLESEILTALMSTGGVASPWMSELFGAVCRGYKSAYILINFRMLLNLCCQKLIFKYLLPEPMGFVYFLEVLP